VIVVAAAPAGVPEVSLSKVDAAERCDLRQVHAVVVDELHVGRIPHDDVARLDIPVRDAEGRELARHHAQRGPQLLQCDGVLNDDRNVGSQRPTFGPVHPDDRVRAALSADAFGWNSKSTK
jgi:hypothetical protein